MLCWSSLFRMDVLCWSSLQDGCVVLVVFQDGCVCWSSFRMDVFVGRLLGWMCCAGHLFRVDVLCWSSLQGGCVVFPLASGIHSSQHHNGFLYWSFISTKVENTTGLHLLSLMGGWEWKRFPPFLQPGTSRMCFIQPLMACCLVGGGCGIRSPPIGWMDL